MSVWSEIVQRYLGAFYAGETQTARQYLADDLSFVGPSVHFHSADEYLRTSAHVAMGVKSLDVQKIFVNNADVCAWYVLELDHPVGSLAVAELFHISRERIASIRMLFDTGPFAVVREPITGAETAVDPVCHMAVDTSAPVATRDHLGATYYFCSAGCAAAFEREPATFLTVAQ